jgi:hypothetical protein
MTHVTFESAVANIKSVLDQATYDEVLVGKQWYSSAHEYAKALAKSGCISVTKAACILAALSPRVSWTNNKRDAMHIVRSLAMMQKINPNQLFAYDANVNKAIAIFWCPSDDESTLFSLVGNGNKTRSFANCILNPRNKRDVCVDTHATSVAAGKRVTANEAGKLVFSKHKGYSQVAAAYIEAGTSRGYTGLEAQAIAWVAYRRLHNIKA